MAICCWCCKLCTVLVVVLIVGLAIRRTFYTVTPPLPDLSNSWWGRDARGIHEDNSIGDFSVRFSSAVINDLYARLNRTKLTDSLPDVKFRYGINSETMRHIVRYWRETYNMDRAQLELNKYDNFLTKLDGIDVHFVHVKPKSSYKNVTPLLMVHGWPGSFYEFYKIIPLLTDPLAHGGKKDDPVFEIICPSIPGYGFSEAPHKEGFAGMHAARMFNELMRRLGHRHYYVQGGDMGSLIVSEIAILYPERVKGVHVNMPITVPNACYFTKLLVGSIFPSLVFNKDDLWKVYPLFEKMTVLLEETGHAHVHVTRPDTIGVGLSDSPAGLAAWIIEKFAVWTKLSNIHDNDGGLATQTFTLDELLHNVMIYWVTDSITTSMRLYKGVFYSDAEHGLTRHHQVSVPSGYAAFPEELVVYPETLVRHEYPNLVHYTDMPTGGHFAAFEQPQLLANDIRKFAQTVEGLAASNGKEEL
ncbi:PREDICTED: epoxide hydrolase 1-like [Priapulus caudatus]|uniref:Epoxide hydrolase n=1 Tax=Priapulus caudatus TaxID=37621 RepID=A0ABM1E8R0_PRICU|nr:PREDICTED: epoxide hydrolase 1-like [Priapulus caudatus]